MGALRLALRIVRLVLKLACVLSLAFVGTGVAALVFVSAMNGCPRLDEGAVQCVSPFYRTVGSFGLGIVMISAFTGLPALMALVGAVWLLRDLWRAWRGRRVSG